jgi:hypothetical protein
VLAVATVLAVPTLLVFLSLPTGVGLRRNFEELS